MAARDGKQRGAGNDMNGSRVSPPGEMAAADLDGGADRTAL